MPIGDTRERLLSLVCAEWEAFQHAWQKDQDVLETVFRTNFPRTFGKCLRPLLFFLCLRLCNWGEPTASSTALAQVLEDVHLASLCHDDVLDDGQLRRGLPSAHVIMGNHHAILAGDFIWLRGWRRLLSLNNFDISTCLQNAMERMVLGQIQEGSLSWSTQEKTYLNLLHDKTAQLFSATCAVAGHLASAKIETIQALKDYGMFWGMGFQLLDDVEDYTRTASQGFEGKTEGQDFLSRKITFPTLWAYHHGTQTQQNRLADLFSGDPTQKTEKDEAFQHLILLLEEMGAFTATRARAEYFFQRAIQCLKSVWNSEEIARSGLLDF